MFITDLSDPAFHSWKVIEALEKGEKGILITKRPSAIFTMFDGGKRFTKLTSNVVVQVSITGLGGTIWEPNVPKWEDAVHDTWRLTCLIDTYKVRVRYDPIIPGVNSSPEDMRKILSAVKHIGIRGVTASVVDLYPHSKQRILAAGLQLPFQGFECPDRRIHLENFRRIAQEVGLEVRFCCEQGFPAGAGGCDWPDQLLDVKELTALGPGCQRGCCGCPKYRQLLSYADKCEHGCLYCYRKG